MFGKSMFIKGEAGIIWLKPFTQKEISSPRALKMFADHEVTQYLRMNNSPTPEDEENFYKKTAEDKNVVAWGIFVNNGPLIGITSIHIDSMNYLASTGFVIFDKKMWRKGIAKLAHVARTHYVSRHLDLKLVTSLVLEPNIGSRRALESVGYFVNGMGIGDHFTNGKHENAYHLTWLNPKYEGFFKIPAHLEQDAQKGFETAKKTLEIAEKVVKYG